MLKKIKERWCDERGFMGLTHSLSAIAIYLLIVVLLPDFIFNNVLHTNSLTTFIGSIIIVAGAALLPDLDNTRSTALSVLGIVGKALSSLMRSSAVAIYLVSKTSRDDDTPNPHRGFWHTIVAGLLVGVIVFITTSISYEVTLFERKMSIGFLFAVMWIFVCAELALAGLFASYTKKIKKSSILGPILLNIFGLGIALLILFTAPSTLSYQWISGVMVIGYILHIIGDTFTVAGTPILWPLNHKGKRWWTYRLAKIHAGGEFEKLILAPVFSISIVIFLFIIFKNNLI